MVVAVVVVVVVGAAAVAVILAAVAVAVAVAAVAAAIVASVAATDFFSPYIGSAVSAQKTISTVHSSSGMDLSDISYPFNPSKLYHTFANL